MVETNLILKFIWGPFSAMLKLIFQGKNVYNRFFTGFVLIITRLPEKLVLVSRALEFTRKLKQQQRRRLRKRQLKSDIALLQTLSRLFYLVQFCKWSQCFFPTWVVKWVIQSSVLVNAIIILKNGKKRTWQGKVWCHKRKLSKISRITKIYMKWNIKEKEST